MSPLFLLSVALKATLLLTLAAVADHVLRGRASAAARHLLWTFAIAGLLLLPVLGWMLPGWSPPLIPARTVVYDAPVALPAAGPPVVDAGAAPEASPAVARNVEPRKPVAAPRLTLAALIPVALGLYLAGVLLLLLKVAGEQWIVRRLRREATEVRDPQWSALLDSARAAMGVSRPVALLRGDTPTIPLAWGIIRPAVLLPAEADEWCDSRRRAVLLHEVAHIARHDCLTQTLAAIACALYWPHPGAWWAAARLRVERELACDDQALARGIRPHEYAGHLLELARGLQAPRALSNLAVSMATPSNLEARLRAAIDEARVRTAPGPRARLVGALLAALLLLPVAAIRSGAARDVPAPAAEPRVEVAAATAPVPVRSAAAGQQQGGIWHLRSATRAESGLEVPAVHLMMNVGGLNTFYAPLSEMDGLSAERIASTADGVRFQWKGDAGTFTFEGAFRGGRGTGRFTFAEDPAFADALARRGIAAATPAQLFSMARHDVSLALVDELAKQGYAMPDAAGLVRLGLSGADLRYLREVGALGYRFRTVGELISFSNSGVTPAFIRALAEMGYGDLPAASLVRLQNHSLTADLVRQLNTRAGRLLSVAELVALRQRGETAAAAPTSFAPAAAPEATAPAPSSSTPLAGHWVVLQTRGSFAYLQLNWDDGTNWDRWIPIASLSGVTAADINSASSPVAFRIEQDAGTFELSGAFQNGTGTGPFRFHPNRGFISTLRSLGLEGVGEATDHQLKNLAWGGMSAADIRELRAAGVTPLTFRGVVDMAVFQVTPEYAREVAAQGRRGISPEELIDLWRSRRR
ncbi:MAG TPA: M56 family metallopeptidase [Longimicrobium sp.]